MWFGGNAISNHIITVAKGITGKARNRTDYASKWYNFQNHLNGHFYVQGRLLIILKYLPESLQYPWQSFEQPIRFWLSVTWASLGVSNAEDGNSNDNMQNSIQESKGTIPQGNLWADSTSHFYWEQSNQSSLHSSHWRFACFLFSDQVFPVCLFHQTHVLNWVWPGLPHHLSEPVHGRLVNILRYYVVTRMTKVGGGNKLSTLDWYFLWKSWIEECDYTLF